MFIFVKLHETYQINQIIVYALSDRRHIIHAICLIYLYLVSIFLFLFISGIERKYETIAIIWTC